MLPRLDREELLTNRDFIAYCKYPTPELDQFWQQYLLQYPEEWQNLEEARLILTALQTILLKEQKKADLDRFKAVVNNPLQITEETKIPSSYFKPGKWLLVAAAILLPFIIYFIGFRQWETNTNLTSKKPIPGDSTFNNIQVIAATNDTKVIATDAAGKKTMRLPDGTLVVLNKNSSLHLKDQFGSNNRELYLSGEGYFDVSHDKKLAFIVHLKDYAVKVHGTAFNIRAYPGDSISETSLLRGSVEVVMSRTDKSILLKPHEKLIVQRDIQPKIPDTDQVKTVSPFQLTPITVSSDGTTILETFWTKNELDISDESFYQFKEKMEHWYNVRIEFQDKEAGNMRFRAKFRDETIEEALKALQLTNAFKFSIHDKVVTIF